MQLALSVAGAVIGGLIGTFVVPGLGTAAGAELGFAIGGIAGTLLVHQKGPAPNDLRVQDSAYGKPIPTVYGIYRAAGNVIWAGQPHQTGGGKGGPPSPATVQMSFAVGVCKGPIKGIRRIWANGKLIYDVSNPSNFQAISGSNQMITGFQVYLGDETQLPDPAIQAAEGVANTPPFRGLAYVVFNNLDLSTWGNYMPSLSFEVIASANITYTVTGQQGVQIAPGTSSFDGAIGTQIDSVGNVYGVAYGNVGIGIGLCPFKLTAYGVEWLIAPNPLTPNAYWYIGIDFPMESCQSYDEPGILTTAGDWYEIKTGTHYNIGFAPGLVAASNGSCIKRNGYIAVTVYIGLGHHSIWVYHGGTLVTGNTSSAWQLVGMSNSYIYAIGIDPADAYNQWLCKFDLNGNFIAQLVHNGLFVSSAGYCVSDTELYIASAGNIFRWDGSTLTDTGIPSFGASALSALRVQNGNAYFSSFGLGNTFAAEVPTFTYTPQSLSSIVADVCANAGLTSGQYDVSALNDSVIGYALTNHSSPRNNLAPLMATYFFDANDTDNQIKFTRRGSGPVGSFAYADLGASASFGDDANLTPITEQVAQEIDLPRTLSFTYNALNADYQVNTQRAFRNVTRSNKDVTMQASIVLPDDEGLMRAQTMLWASWVGRKTFQFSTSLAYLRYEPGDVMTLYGATGQAYLIRITRCTYDGQGNLQWEAQLEEPDIYPSATYNAQGGAPQGFTPQLIEYAGPTILALLDVPPLRDSDTSPQIYIGACGLADNWPGAMVDISRDGSTYTQLQRILNPSVIGYTTSALGNFRGGNQPDELSTLNVTLYHGALSSVSYANFLGGVNAAYIGGELVFFRNATQTGALTYTLSGFLRGRVGTEYEIAGHAIGEPFVFLDPNALIAPSLNVADVGATLYYEPHLLNLFANQPADETAITPSVACVKPLSPVLFNAGKGSASSVNDISLSWIRRARVNAQWLNNTDVPLDESTEAYTLTISNSSGTVVRTVSVPASTSYVYSAANITADGFTTGNTINFSVAQNSNQGVLGFAALTSIVR
ncbi:phage tail protein [Paraburkholderia sp. SIMBA_049]